MSYLIILPSIYREYTDACIESMALDLQENTIIVNNDEGKNLGVSKSWNIGIDNVISEKKDWLILLSAAIRFGEFGGLDFINHLNNEKEHFVMEANKVFGWHLIAFSREVLEQVGHFDENLFPGYYNDIDYSWRIQKTFELRHEEGLPLWTKVDVDVVDTGMAHAVNLAGVRSADGDLWAYMAAKWGDVKIPYFARPFNDPAYELRDWPRGGQTWLT